jgi:cytoskeletal protein CcmA (bactofilin family)
MAKKEQAKFSGMLEGLLNASQEKTVDKVEKEEEDVKMQEEAKKIAVIPEGTSVQGDINLDTSVEIGGMVTGDITSDGAVTFNGAEITGNVNAIDITAEETALSGELKAEKSITIVRRSNISGNLKADSITIDAKVDGNIEAISFVSLLNSADVHGDITAPRIIIQDGAKITGVVTIGQ